MLFGVTPDNFCFETGDILDLAVNIDANYFNGEYSVSVQIKALRMSGTDDEKLFGNLSAFNDFLSGYECETSELLPSREEVGEVYKFIAERPVLEDRIKYFFMNKIGFGKTLVSIKTLEELGLIEKTSSGKYNAVQGAVKTSLTNSEIFRTLSERSGKDE